MAYYFLRPNMETTPLLPLGSARQGMAIEFKDARDGTHVVYTRTIMTAQRCTLIADSAMGTCAKEEPALGRATWWQAVSNMRGRPVPVIPLIMVVLFSILTVLLDQFLLTHGSKSLGIPSLCANKGT